MSAVTTRPNVNATPTCVTFPPETSSTTIAPVPAKTSANVPTISASTRRPPCARVAATRSSAAAGLAVRQLPRAHSQARDVVGRRRSARQRLGDLAIERILEARHRAEVVRIALEHDVREARRAHHALGLLDEHRAGDASDQCLDHREDL